MEWIDTHCHLNDPAFDADREEARTRAREAGVSTLVCIGADLAGSRRAAHLSQEPGIFAAIGIHPEAGAEWTSETADALRELYAQTPGIVAYGEIGLDYHWESVPREHQQQVFLEQIAFAATLSPTLPLVIHCRDAQDDVLMALHDSGTSAPVVMHCFTGDIDAARAVLDAGCLLGIGGVATFKKAQALREAIAFSPLDRLLLETDCPYLAPQPWRGRRNEPSYLPAIGQAVADAKSLSLEAVADATTANARRVFGLLTMDW